MVLPPGDGDVDGTAPATKPDCVPAAAPSRTPAPRRRIDRRSNLGPNDHDHVLKHPVVDINGCGTHSDATIAAAKIRIARQCRRTQTRRSSRLILRQRAAISADLGQCGCGASEQLRHVGGNRLKRTGAMALACGGQLTKMTDGVPAGLSSSMMISEPFTRALARVVDLDKAGSFPV
jgi:hypothetical protein